MMTKEEVVVGAILDNNLGNKSRRRWKVAEIYTYRGLQGSELWVRLVNPETGKRRGMGSLSMSYLLQSRWSVIKGEGSHGI